jgi:mono/diheme cytochrome c family protein
MPRRKGQKRRRPAPQRRSPAAPPPEERAGAPAQAPAAARRTRSEAADDLLETPDAARATPEGREGSLFMGVFVALSALVTGLLLSGWTPGSLNAPSTPERTAAPPSAPAPSSARTEPTINPNSIPAKRIFGAYCGTCHTLNDAGAQGVVGPNLDQLRPSRASVARAIRVGGRGSGNMPPQLLTGRSAVRVAAYVARVAGT